MIRRTPLVLVAGALATLTLLPACSNDSADAARVGDATLTVDQLDSVISEASQIPSLQDQVVTTDPDGGAAVMNADLVRTLITTWARGQVVRQDVESLGGEVTAADRQTVEDSISQAASSDWDQAGDAFKDFYLDAYAPFEAYSRVEVPADDPLQERYDAGIATSGWACVSHILVATEDEAKQVEEELAGGTAFADVAANRSTDTGSAPNGGAITDQNGNPCIARDTFQSNFVPPFVDAALSAKVGVPTDPVQSQFGWHVILVRPYEEVKSAVRLDLLLGESDVWVASQYGTWGPAGSVIPVTPPTAATNPPTS